LTAVGFNRSSKKPLSYYNSYVKDGFQTEKKLPDQGIDDAFDRATDIQPLFSKIDRPLLVYFSKDDPVLSNPESAIQPAVITKILQQAQTNPQITVFNPKYGAHTGALLDPIFGDLVGTFFAPGMSPPDVRRP
jgi:hypothetical protein